MNVLYNGTINSKILWTICLTVFFICVTAVQYEDFYRDPTDFTLNHLEDKIPIFKSLQEVIERLEVEAAMQPMTVNNLLTDFNRSATTLREEDLPKRNRKPFIVIDGNNRKYVTYFAKNISERMNAELLRLPTGILKNYYHSIPKDSDLRKPYFALCVYELSNKVKEAIKAGRPVIATGYWTNQACYSIEKRFDNLPPVNHSIYEAPADLYPPDLIFYINYDFDEEKKKVRKVPSFTQKRNVQIYRRFLNQSVFVVNMWSPYYVLTRQIPNVIYSLLQNKRDLNNFFSGKYSARKYETKPTAVSMKKDVQSVVTVYSMDYMKYRYPVFWSIDQLMERLELERKKEPLFVANVLETFYRLFTKQADVALPEGRKRKPFIVFMGKDMRVIKFIQRRIAHLMGAEMVSFPPKELKMFKNMTRRNVLKRIGLYSLGCYAVSNVAKRLLSIGIPVIGIGYWHSMASYEIWKKYHVAPPKTEHVYDFPSDLYAPDIVIFIETEPFGNHTELPVYQMVAKQRYIDICKRFKNPQIYVVRMNYGYETLANVVSRLLRNKLKPIRDFHITNQTTARPHFPPIKE